MNALKHWSRRSVTALMFSFIAWRRADARPAQTPLQQRLLSLFENIDAACVMGEVCLKILPHDARAFHHVETMVLAAAPFALKSEMTRHISEDFANGNIVIVDGWHLSRTEAWLYALVAINFPRSA